MDCLAKQGTKCSGVRLAQRLLELEGCDPGPIDGVFGAKTRAAVVLFQKARNIIADGTIGNVTFRALERRLSLGNRKLGNFLIAALYQEGDAYVYGAEVSLADCDPDAFDCSELVQWACARAGIYMPDGSSAQREYCPDIPTDEAIVTPGALLFAPGHVAISLGCGRTIEARGSAYGIGVFYAPSSRFESGGLIPGIHVWTIRRNYARVKTEPA